MSADRPAPVPVDVRTERRSTRPSLHGRQLHAFRAVLVERVERKATRDQAGPWRRGAIAERPAHQLTAKSGPGEHVAWQVGIRERHPPEADHRRPAVAHHRLADVGQPLLQVRVPRADHGHVASAPDERRGGRHLTGDADERILGGQVAVGGWEQRWPLHMRAVVGAAGGRTHQTDAERAQHLDQRQRLGEVDPASVLARAEGEPIRLVGHGDPTTIGAGRERHGVEHREPHSDCETRRGGPDALDDGAHEPRAVREVAAVATRPVEGAQQLVAEVAVARLDVDEVETRFAREDRTVDERRHEFIELSVGQHRGFPGTGRAVEEWMTVRGTWCRPVRQDASSGRSE